MSATSALENGEDLENVPLVRMQDVQPDRSVKATSMPRIVSIKSLANDCVMNEDDDSNIGSMVSIEYEEVVNWHNENSDCSELIVSKVDPLQLNTEKSKPKQSDSWPTLEILPGGVIKNADKYKEDLIERHNKKDKNKNDVGMYVCAKCSDSFDSLILLVKHVRCHEEEKKKEKLSKQLDLQSNKKFPIQTCKRKLLIDLKTKCKVPKKA